MPRVSVILPVFNAHAYIQEAVSSILCQTYRDFELIVVDDASSDGTSTILDGLRDKRIKRIRHDHNTGLVRTLNDGLALATGEFVARMDHDDISMPQRLERQISCLLDRKEIGVLGTGFQLINGQGLLGSIYEPAQTHAEINWLMPFLCPIAHPTVFMRTSILIEAGGYAEEAACAEDYDLWERLMSTTQFANLRFQLLRLRKHDTNMTKLWDGMHIAAANRVAQRWISQQLGRPVAIHNVCCLQSSGRLESSHIEETAELVHELTYRALRKDMSFSSKIKRDAAKRLAMLAFNSKFRLRLKLIRQAHALSPSIAVALALRALSKFSGVSSIKIMA